MNPSAHAPHSPVGRLEHHPLGFAVPGLTPRAVDVWLPDRLDHDPTLRARVLYMHDGQNLFDEAFAYGAETWGVAQTLTRLIEAGDLEPVIVVGIWNSPQRWRDYYPRNAFQALPPDAAREVLERLGGEPLSEVYADGIVQVLKPWVDATYPTRPTPEHTFVMGSSMGALISLYSLERHPDVFGGAGCLSTHWTAGEAAMVDALADGLPRPGAHRLYFDYGTQTLDALYESWQQRMDAHLHARGWTDAHWTTRKFVGAAHDEASWRARLEVPLRFLLRSAA